MYLRLGLHMKIRLYYVLPYKVKISTQHGIGFILDRCIVYLGLTMQTLQKKRLLIFEIFNFKKVNFFFFGTENSLLFPSYTLSTSCKNNDTQHEGTLNFYTVTLKPDSYSVEPKSKNRKKGIVLVSFDLVYCFQSSTSSKNHVPAHLGTVKKQPLDSYTVDPKSTKALFSNHMI